MMELVQGHEIDEFSESKYPDVLTRFIKHDASKTLQLSDFEP
jgi:hypothetical protein